MMKILIVSATPFEIDPLIKRLSNTIKAEHNLLTGELQNHQITIVITGVGMVATTYFTTKAINKKFDLAINAGVCGSFNTNIDIGTVVNIYEDTFSELGAEDGDTFLSLSEIELEGVQKISNLNLNFKNNVIEKLPKVNGITVNTVHGKDDSIKKVFEKFHPMVESMEGAAFMMVCEKENIPYIQVRGVSNYVESRNKENWNIPLAIKNLNNSIIEIISNFNV